MMEFGSWGCSHVLEVDLYTLPRCSMYGIFTNICPKNHPNVGKYTIHGAYTLHKERIRSVFDPAMLPGKLHPYRKAKSQSELQIGVCPKSSKITIWFFNIAMENGPFIDGLPIKNGDFPWLC
jgi:hypothetical protein